MNATIDHVRTPDGFLVAMDVMRSDDGYMVTIYGPSVAYVSPGRGVDSAVIHFVGGSALEVRADYQDLRKVLFAGTRL